MFLVMREHIGIEGYFVILEGKDEVSFRLVKWSLRKEVCATLAKV